MMAEKIIDVRPGGDFAWTKTANLGTTAVRLRFRWLPQLLRWTMRMETPGGVVLTSQSLCQAEGSVPFDPYADGAPGGSLRWEGLDTRQASDLGTRLRLIWTEP